MKNQQWYWCYESPIFHLVGLNTKLLTVDHSTSVKKTEHETFCLRLDSETLQSAHLNS